MKVTSMDSISTAINQSAQGRIERMQDSSFISKLKPLTNPEDDKKLKQATKDFEAEFVKMMMSEMRKTVDKSDLIESTPGTDMFQSMFDDKVSEEEANGKGMGLAAMLYKQMRAQLDNKFTIDENK